MSYFVDDSGLVPYLVELQAQKGLARRTNRIEYVNNARYAEYIEANEKFYIFNVSKLADFLENRVKELIESQVVLTQQELDLSLEAGAIEGIDWHRRSSFEFGTRPPVRMSEGLRAAHPGGWADVTGNLNARFWYRINNAALARKAEWFQEEATTRRAEGTP